MMGGFAGMRGKETWRVALGIFVFLLALYVLTYSGRLHVVDEFYMLAVTESLSKGRLDINQIASLQWGFAQDIERVGTFGPLGDVFCKKGIGVSLLALPFFKLSTFFPPIGSVHTALLTNITLTALTGALLFVHMRSIGLTRRVSLVCALLYGVGTLAWPYTRTLFAEPTAALGLTLALYGCSRFHRTHRVGSALIGGLGSGIALCAVSSSLFLLPVFGVALLVSAIGSRDRRRWKSLWRAIAGWALGLAGPVAIVLLYNLLRFSSPWMTGWALSREEFSFPILRGLFGLFLSPAKGLFFYSPIFVLVLPGWVLGLRKRRFDTILILALLGVFVGIYATWIRWDAGWSWGPRYLVPVLPLMMLLVVEVWAWVDRRRSTLGYVLLSIVALLTVAVQLLGAAGDFVQAEFVLWEMPKLRKDDWYILGRRALFDIHISPLVLQVQHLLHGELDWSWMSMGVPDGLALGASLVGVAVAAVVLGMAWKSHAWFCIAAGLAGVFLILSTSVVLARATERPFYDLGSDGRTEALAHIASHKLDGDGVVSVVPYLHELIMDRYPDLPPIYGLLRAQEDLVRTERLLENALQRHGRLWFLSVWTRPGDWDNHTELWLMTHAFPLETHDFDGYRVILFSSPVEPQTASSTKVTFAQDIYLERVAIARTGEPSTLQLLLEWRSARAVVQDYQVFVHVYDSDGNRVAQADHGPGGGFFPTSTWMPGESIADRIAVSLPAGADDLRLALGLYAWQTGERLPASAGSATGPVDVVVADDVVWLPLGSVE